MGVSGSAFGVSDLAPGVSGLAFGVSFLAGQLLVGVTFVTVPSARRRKRSSRGVAAGERAIMVLCCSNAQAKEARTGEMRGSPSIDVKRLRRSASRSKTSGF